jgi:uncharacterized protein YjbJ (UPF0337 family)
MNKDRTKGKANETLGAARTRVGHAVGNDAMEAKGQSQVVKGKIQSTLGDVKDRVTDAMDKAEKFATN